MKNIFRGSASGSILAIASLGLAAPLAAQTTTTSVDNGWYNQSGSHSPGNTNTITGDCCGQGEYRGFWVFDLSGISSASSVSITFFGNNGNFRTDSGSETAHFYDYTGSITSLLGGTGGAAAFSDLGSGALLGEYTITAPNFSRMPEFTVNLSSAFVSQFNNTIGTSDQRIALGAALQTFNLGGTEESFWSSSVGSPAARLNIVSSAGAVPEPATWAMMLLGFGFVGGVMRTAKRRRRQRITVAYA